MLGALESVFVETSVFREIGHRIVARLEEHEDSLAIGDPVSAEAHPLWFLKTFRAKANISA
jgi:hypothetical protein